jgi:transposase
MRRIAPSSRQRARPHVPENTEFVTNNNMVIVPHPPYSPDLAPCDLILFPKMKTKPKGRCFETVFDIQRESQTLNDSIEENDFHGAFEALEKRWDRCIRSQGDGCEGDGRQN